MSDHLLEVMTEWKKSLVGVDGDFELLFERFEMMGALVAFEENDEVRLEEAAKSASAHNDALAWMPIGRADQHIYSSRVLLQELQDEAFALELSQPDTRKNSRRFIELSKQNFMIYTSRIRW